MFIIYLITNAANGKLYVGKTSRSVEQRLKEHIQESRTLRNRHLCKAIRKHGKDAFNITPIRTADTAEDANWLESLYIGISRSHLHEFGYNDTFGGDGVRGTPETRKKISDAKIGICLTEEHKQKLKVARRGRTPALGMIHPAQWRAEHSARMTGAGHPLFGKKHSEESRKRMSESQKARLARKKAELK